MNRQLRQKTIRSALVALSLSLGALWGGQALAEQPDEIVARLRMLGYDEVVISRSWLGKAIVTGARRGDLREIVIDPRNGAVISDTTFRDTAPRSERQDTHPAAQATGQTAARGSSSSHSTAGATGGDRAASSAAGHGSASADRADHPGNAAGAGAGRGRSENAASRGGQRDKSGAQGRGKSQNASTGKSRGHRDR